VLPRCVSVLIILIAGSIFTKLAVIKEVTSSVVVVVIIESDAEGFRALLGVRTGWVMICFFVDACTG